MPRITVDIDNKTHEALKLIPYGMRRLVYRAVLEKLATEIRKSPENAMTAIVELHMTVRPPLKPPAKTKTKTRTRKESANGPSK